ncbi:unnamed protein product [Euphydryas editha]|uniref:Gag-like protein n=1 Tax=Euphydryas editha TaxID=104508 RepID=A0AAU9TYH9_EUPED|nr:unnamed protein product [Euphydryas editha]
MIRTPGKEQGTKNPPSKTPPKVVKKLARRSLERFEPVALEHTFTVSESAPTTSKAKSPKEGGVAWTLSPATATKSRVREATALLTKGRTAVSQSKNLRGDLKETILSSLDGLKKLVADAESALEAERARKGSGGSGGVASANITAAVAPAVSPDPGLSGKLDEHSRLLLESNRRMEALQEQLKRCSEAAKAASQRTYTSVAAVMPQHPIKPAALHSVLISSSDEKETGEEVLNRVRKTIDAKEGWVKVERVRKAKDRRVIMGFGSAEERNKARDRMSREGSGLVVEEIKNRDPLLVLRGVLSVNTDEDILKALRSQNRDLFDDLGPLDDRLQIKYRRRARNPHVAHVVLSASPTLWGRITGMGSVHIDLQRVRAEDQSPLVQCSRCLGYGHRRKFCKDPADLCSHCGGPHLRSKCADWLAGSPPSCRNCRKAKLDNVEHNAFSDDCPVRRRWDDLARSSVAYC